MLKILQYMLPYSKIWSDSALSTWNQIHRLNKRTINQAKGKMYAVLVRFGIDAVDLAVWRYYRMVYYIAFEPTNYDCLLLSLFDEHQLHFHLSMWWVFFDLFPSEEDFFLLFFRRSFNDRIKSQSSACCAVIRRCTSTVSILLISFFVSSETWDQYLAWNL